MNYKPAVEKFPPLVPIPEEVFQTLKKLNDLAEQLTGAGAVTTVTASMQIRLQSGSVRLDMRSAKASEDQRNNIGAFRRS